MEVSKEMIQGCEIVNEGTTSFILRNNTGAAFKVYKREMAYIAGNSEYSGEKDSTLSRLSYIVSQQDKVKKTKLPNEVLTFNGCPVGTQIPYFENAVTLKSYLEDNPETDLEEVKGEMFGIVGELIEHGIIPTDPHFENFLVTFDEEGKRQINMVDVDDVYVSIYSNGKRDVFYDSEVAACYRVLDLSFESIRSKRM